LRIKASIAAIAGSADNAGNAKFGSGDCPSNGYVVANLKIRTNRLVRDGRKLQSPWGRFTRTVHSGAVASGGDCVLRSATRIPSLHRSGLERQ